MRKKLLVSFSFTLLAVTCAAAQAPTVTNLDLEKYRVERNKADADLRENYAKLGFSSPEVLERRRIESRSETEKLSSTLRAERIERERLAAQQEESARFAAYYRSTMVETWPETYSRQYYWSYDRRLRRPIVQGQTQTGYFAGGQFWPTGPTTKSRPLFVRPRNR
jgi:hypothetical protein